MRQLHPWDVSSEEALALQRRLASQVCRQDRVPPQVRHVAGVDLSPPDAQGAATGAAVVLTYPGLEVVEVRTGRGVPRMPYVPGLLSFRESPVLLEALGKLATTPDLLLVDGQGIAHPRRLGIAAHLGLLVDLPTIGCAKSILRGRHDPLPQEAGAWAPLVDRGEVVGAAVRTRSGVAPVYVSIGNKVDLPAAIQWTLRCCRGYRLPEPVRLAHQAAAGRLPEQAPASGRQARLL